MAQKAEARGTSETFRHNHDIPITRKSIAAEQAARAKEGRPPLVASGIVFAFVSLPKYRHFRRAELLMAPKVKPAETVATT